MSFTEELKRRNVAKVAVLYVVFAWLILQVTDVLSSLLPVPEWTGSLVFVLLLIGCPAVLIFSWIYELTPEGLKREKDVDRSQSITDDTGRKINVLIVVLLVLAIGVVIVDRLIPEAGPVPGTVVVDEVTGTKPADPSELAAIKFAPAPERSVAVLPFVNMSSDPEQEYFSDGLSEELLNLLAQIPDLTVASRTSAFSFKGKDVTIAEVAETLGVAHILEGSVRKSGNQVRITAQLIDATRDVHLWSETWDRTLDNVFAIQDEIAASVVESLRVTLLGSAPESVATDPEAYNLYLQGRHLEKQGSRDSMLKAVELFERALAIDPDYAPAWTGMSTAYINLAGSRAIPRAEGYAKGREAAEKALAVDPDNADSLTSLGWIAGQYQGDYAEQARYLSQALAIAPNDESVLNSAAVLLQDLNRIDEAIRIHHYLIDRDPVSSKAYHNLAVAYYSAGDLDAAEAALDQALALSPENLLARWWGAYLNCAQDKFEDCLRGYESLAEDSGVDNFRVLGQAGAYPGLGREKEGAESMARLEEVYADDFPYYIAWLHARQGHIDQAIDWLEIAYEREGAAAISYVNHDPLVPFLLDEPRVQALLKKAGISQEQLDAIDFQVDIPK